MLRFILVCVIVVGFLILSIPLLLIEWVIGKFNPMAKDLSSLRIVQGVFRFILFVAGIQVTIIGQEHIPTDSPVLYIGNHRSFFDILITYVRCFRRTGYIAKKEMLKVPLLSNWMKYLHCLFLDRKNIKEGLKTILTAIEKVESGISICIFPEGTRNKNVSETELLPFHEGSFKIASKANCPIVPMVLHNTSQIWEDHFPKIKPTKVVLEYLPPIYLDQLEKEQKKFPGAYCQTLVQEALNKYKSH